MPRLDAGGLLNTLQNPKSIHHVQAAAAPVRTGKERGGKEAKEAEPPGPRKFTAEETVYSQHPWNINNMPRCKARLLARNKLRYGLKLKPNEDLCGHQKLVNFG